jgi:hypothetical protein
MSQLATRVCSMTTPVPARGAPGCRSPQPAARGVSRTKVGRERLPAAYREEALGPEAERLVAAGKRRVTEEDWQTLPVGRHV